MKQRREGFTLVEVVVAMTLLSIVLVSLSGLVYRTARQAITATALSGRQAVAVEAVNRFATLPFAQLAGNAGCSNVTRGPNVFARCIAVSVTGNRAAVTVTVTPPDDTPAWETRFVRVGPPPTNPLCVGC